MNEGSYSVSFGAILSATIIRESIESITLSELLVQLVLMALLHNNKVRPSDLLANGYEYLASTVRNRLLWSWLVDLLRSSIRELYWCSMRLGS